MRPRILIVIVILFASFVVWFNQNKKSPSQRYVEGFNYGYARTDKAFKAIEKLEKERKMQEGFEAGVEDGRASRIKEETSKGKR